MKKVVVVTDVNSADQALYIDGEYTLSDHTIYAADIASQVGDEPFTLDAYSAESDGELWPKRIEKLKRV